MSRIVKAADVVYADAPVPPSEATEERPDGAASSGAVSNGEDGRVVFPPLDSAANDVDGAGGAGGSNGSASGIEAGGASGASRPADSLLWNGATASRRATLSSVLDGARAMRAAKREAGQLLEAARREAENVLESAGEAAEQLKRAAREEGLAAGKQEASDRVHEQFRDVLQALRAARQEAVRLTNTLATDLGPEWVRLSLAIAERLVCKEIEDGADVALRVGRDILRGAASGGKLTVRLNPADFDQLQQSGELSGLRASGTAAETVDVVPDEGVGRGGCLLETDNGVVDGRIGTRLAELERTLLEHAKEVRDADGDDADRNS